MPSSVFPTGPTAIPGDAVKQFFIASRYSLYPDVDGDDEVNGPPIGVIIGVPDDDVIGPDKVVPTPGLMIPGPKLGGPNGTNDGVPSPPPSSGAEVEALDGGGGPNGVYPAGNDAVDVSGLEAATGLGLPATTAISPAILAWGKPMSLM